MVSLAEPLIEDIAASGRKSLVDHILLHDTSQVRIDNEEAKRILTLCGLWSGFPITNNTKALLIMFVLFSTITVGQYFAATAVGSQALIADVTSMAVDAVSYLGNIFGECPEYPAQRIVTQLFFSFLSVFLLFYFNTEVMIESIGMLKDRPNGESGSSMEGIIVMTFAGLGILFDAISLFSFRHFALKEAKEQMAIGGGDDQEGGSLVSADYQAVTEEGDKFDEEGVKVEKPEINMMSALLHVSADLFRSSSTFILGVLMTAGVLSPAQSNQGDAVLAITICCTIYLAGFYALYEWSVALRKWWSDLAKVDMEEERGGAADILLG